MDKVLKIVLLVVISVSGLSCGSNKILVFDSAYKFSNYNYKKSIQPKDSSISGGDETLTVSLKTEMNDALVHPFPDINQGDNLQPELPGAEIEELKDQFRELNRREKRIHRREIKQKIRQIKEEMKVPNSTLDTKKVNEISTIMRWSIVIGSVGLVLLILGAIFSGTLATIGAVFVVGGIALFIVDQLQ